MESLLSKDGVGVLAVGVLTDGVRGSSKSQETPCLWQLPQTGCTAGCQVEPSRGEVQRISTFIAFDLSCGIWISKCLSQQTPSKQAAGTRTVLATLTPRFALLMRSPRRHCVAVTRVISRNGARECLRRVLHIDTPDRSRKQFPGRREERKHAHFSHSLKDAPLTSGQLRSMSGSKGHSGDRAVADPLPSRRTFSC